MKYCQSCGKQLPDEAAFCDECGTRVGQFKNARPESKTSSVIKRRSKEKRFFFRLPFQTAYSWRYCRRRVLLGQ